MRLFLRLTALIILLVGTVHITLGIGGEALLGSAPSAETLANPGLDSQNRFYGAAFILYAVLLWIGAAEPQRHRTVLLALFGCFFLGGLARLVSIAMTGTPPPAILLLLASELLIPAYFWWWLSRQARNSP